MGVGVATLDVYKSKVYDNNIANAISKYAAHNDLE